MLTMTMVVLGYGEQSSPSRLIYTVTTVLLGLRTYTNYGRQGNIQQKYMHVNIERQHMLYRVMTHVS